MAKPKFATLIAHSTTGDYAPFNKSLALGRPFRQPIIAAADPKYVDGLEIFFSSASEVTPLYAMLNGNLYWKGTPERNGTGQIEIRIEETVGKALRSLPIFEAPPSSIFYDNVGARSFKEKLIAILLSAYKAANDSKLKDIHPAISSFYVYVKDEKTGKRGKPLTLRDFIKNSSVHPEDLIKILANNFVDGTTEMVYLNYVPVLAGDGLGNADTCGPKDLIPEILPFPRSDARRATIRMVDRGDQSVDPIYYLNAFMRQITLAETLSVVSCLTTILADGKLKHPLVDLCRDRGIADLNSPPPPRSMIGGVDAFAIGSLGEMHQHARGAEAKKGGLATAKWRYTVDGLFEAKDTAESPVGGLKATEQSKAKVRKIWQDFGKVIVDVSKACQIPCELIVAIIAKESRLKEGHLDERSVRFEPLKSEQRKVIAAADQVLELKYDHTAGTQGKVTDIKSLGTGELSVTFTVTGSWTWNQDDLKKNKRLLLVGDADRVSIHSNSAHDRGKKIYSLTVSCPSRSGSIAGKLKIPFGTTLEFAPSVMGQSSNTAGPETLVRGGEIKNLVVSARNNAIDGPTKITLLLNNIPSACDVTLNKGCTQGSNMAALSVNKGDRLGVRVATDGTAGELSALEWSFAFGIKDGETCYVLDGRDFSAPDPWRNDLDILTGRDGLTWKDALDLIDRYQVGKLISVGLTQTLVSTAKENIETLGPKFAMYLRWFELPNPHPAGKPASDSDYLNDWLLYGKHSIVAGAAKLRFGYATMGTKFDLPVAASAFNDGCTPSKDSPWGLLYYGNYVEQAAPFFNAAVEMANADLLEPKLAVRFRK
jgi:hypothetical protein